MKFFGKIGFVTTEETKPGVFEEVATERDYYGDVTRNSRKWEPGEYLNDEINVSNTFSIMSDGYLLENFGAMRYLVWHGTKWKISSIEEQRPRVILSVRGVYNGN